MCYSSSVVSRVVQLCGIIVGVDNSTKITSDSTVTTTTATNNISLNQCYCNNSHQGFGNDSHGQNATKAAIRACRNAIEFNSIPSIGKLVPGGYDGLLLHVLLAVPLAYQPELDLDAIRQVFPYGTVQFTIQNGGMIASSGIAIQSLGDVNDEMVVVCAAVTVGY